MYVSRLVEKEIEKKLRTSGAVVVAGPKFCGKTTTCMRYQKSFVKLNTKQSIALAKLDPKSVLVGDNPASQIYVRNKEKACEKVGIESRVIVMDKDSKEEDVINKVLELSNDKTVNGLLVQLPLPNGIDKNKVISVIPEYKDVDGLTKMNIARLVENDNPIVPCTPKGVVDLLKYYNIDPCSKKVAIIGRSMLVGKPLFSLLTNMNATCTLCHSKTKNISEITKEADIVVCALGSPLFLTKDMVKEGAVVIDVGINRLEDKIVGDADFDNLFDKVSYITPVPGGCGPMTVAELLNNTVECFYKQQN